MIVVVGSANRDLVVTTQDLPRAGETVLGTGHGEVAGGKGANQAVAAARLGARVAFVGRVGDDEAGRMLVAAFEVEGVDASHVSIARHTPTGLAVITVDGSGENTIVVSPGANALVGMTDVAGAAASLRSAAVTLVQLEIPIQTATVAALSAGGTVILNAAPAQPLNHELLGAIDVLVVNRSELAALTGSEDPRLASVLEVPTTVVTLGAEGAALVEADNVTVYPAPVVDVVDTTGAGDAFCGALAAGLDAGLSIEESVPRAVTAGALATTALGARSALPTAAEVDAA
jgi:ribokinase